MASLCKVFSERGYPVRGVVSPELGRRVLDAKPTALVVLAARGDADDVELVRAARRRGTQVLMVSLSAGGAIELVVDGTTVQYCSNRALLASVESTIGATRTR